MCTKSFNRLLPLYVFDFLSQVVYFQLVACCCCEITGAQQQQATTNINKPLGLRSPQRKLATQKH